MSDVVFILGAGASAKAGGPLMSDFLRRARELHRRGRIPGPTRQGTRDPNESFQTVSDAISCLQSVQSKSDLDIHNVEWVFSAFQMAETLGWLHGFGGSVKDLPDAMVDVITNTIEQTVLFPAHRGHLVPPEPYEGFALLVERLANDACPPASVAVITFNYDVAVDYALARKRSEITYALGEPAGGSAVPLLKLHGSLNWGWCDQLGKVAPFNLLELRKRLVAPENDPGWAFCAGSHIADYQYQGNPVASQPVIVPPTWEKGRYREALSDVWRRAAEELREAHSIIVIGYSLPWSDAFFRLLYALGSVGPSVLEDFLVFDPDPSGDVELRFRGLLGPGAKPTFEFHREEFVDAIAILETRLVQAMT